MITTKYTYTAPHVTFGVRPHFIIDPINFCRHAALGDFLQRLQHVRLHPIADETARCEQIGQWLDELQFTTAPKQAHHYQLVNAHHKLQLDVGDKNFDLELWWPQSWPGQNPPKGTPEAAKPCCAAFLLRDLSAPQNVQIRLGYQPGVLLIDARDPQLPVMMATHEIKKNLAGQITAIDVQTACDPNLETHRLHCGMQIIQLGDYAANQELNAPLWDVRRKLAACHLPDLDDGFALDLAWLFQFNGAAKLRVHQR